MKNLLLAGLIAVGVASAWAAPAHAQQGYCAGNSFTKTSSVGLVGAELAQGVQLLSLGNAQIPLAGGVPVKMLWADFDGDGFDELAVVREFFDGGLTLPPSSSALDIVDGNVVVPVGFWPGPIN